LRQIEAEAAKNSKPVGHHAQRNSYQSTSWPPMP
jgi:hypothetical protein